MEAEKVFNNVLGEQNADCSISKESLNGGPSPLGRASCSEEIESSVISKNLKIKVDKCANNMNEISKQIADDGSPFDKLKLNDIGKDGNKNATGKTSSTDETNVKVIVPVSGGGDTAIDIIKESDACVEDPIIPVSKVTESPESVTEKIVDFGNQYQPDSSDEDSDSWDDDSDSTSSSDDSSSSSSSSTSSSSSLTPEEQSDIDINDIIGDESKKNEFYNKSNTKTEGEMELEDLPPIEDLHISVPKTDCIEIGVVANIVDKLVVVQANKDTPALDLDSILFVNEGEKPLGHIFDVFGPVKEPCYCVRFNSQDHVKERGIERGMKVYTAPQHLQYVFLTNLLKQKGSDASWEFNNEPPAKYIDYSDDEEERKAKNKNRNTDRMERGESDAAKRKHHSYEQRMNERNLKMSERKQKHFNRPAGPQGRQKFGSSSQQPIRPWGVGPGQVRPEVWQTGGSMNNANSFGLVGQASQYSRVQPSAGIIKPPTFNFSGTFQAPSSSAVPPPSSFVHVTPPVPPIPGPQTPSQHQNMSFSMTNNCTENSNQYSWANYGQQSFLARSESIPVNLNTSPQGFNCYTPFPQNVHRSSSMPSVLAGLPNWQSQSHAMNFAMPDTRFPPPPMQNNSFSAAGASGQYPLVRSPFPNPPPAVPPPPPGTNWYNN